MRKSFLFCALLAVIAMMTGCQKEQDGITLQAVIDQDTKAYIGSINSHNYPFWENNDPVIINGESKNIQSSSANGTCGTISGVTFSAPYCAFFPANIVNSMSEITSNSTSGTASIYLNTHQKYREVYEGGPQKVDMPMAAFTTRGTTLIFKNLCSVIRVEVQTNTDIGSFEVRSISVTAAGTSIAGQCTATISPEGVSLTTNEASNNTVTLHRDDYSNMGTINPNYPKSFYIIVPAFSSSAVSISVEAEDGRYFSQTVSNAHIDRSTIAPITLDASDHEELFHSGVAYLIPGANFNELITNSNTTTYSAYPSFDAISFVHVDEFPEHGSNEVWKKLSTADSPNEVWGHVEGTTLKVVTTAYTVYANSSCSTMFQGLTNVSNIQLENGVFFNTSQVTDMSYMFAGCDNLGSAFSGLEHFNTTNVTTMAHMFDGCSTLGTGGLSLRSFDTRNLVATGMIAMFNGCTNLQSLDLSSFTTGQITNMTDLFNGCGHMHNLDIRHFNMDNVEYKEGMCDGLHNSSLYETFVITCTQGVADELLEVSDGTNTTITGIIPNTVDWHIVPEQQ